jgi:hypothetical protein
MIYDDASNICAIPNECKQIPPCSYQIVLTSNQSVFNVDDINGVDCSENGQYGSKYRWVLESSHSNSIYNPNDNLNNYDYWSPIDSSELNELCIRDEEMLTSHLSTVSESTESYICNCTDASYSTSMHYFISDYFSDNNGDGFETIEGICGSNDCGVKRYHQANVRLNACNGDRYKNVASNIGSSNCVNEEACRRKCLNTGQLDGDPVVVPYTDTAPITCYAPVTNEEINRFSYYGTDPNTCSSNVCSDTEYGNCSYQVLNANDGWGTKEIVLGTDNKNYRFIHNSVDGEIFNLGTGLSRNENENTINYDTRTEEQVGCPDSSDHTVSSNLYTKKSVYKYTRAIKQVDDDTCFPVSEKSQVKYTIEEDDTPCPKDCVYYWETDVSGYPVYGDCSSICKDTNDSVVKKTQKYVNRDGNSAGESTCPSPNSTELGLHTIYCDNIPLCCTPNDGIWGHYMYNNVSYGVDGVCPLCTFDGKSFDLTRTTTGKVTCHPITGVADTTKQSEDTKTCTPPPNTCGAEVPGTSSSSCSQPDGQPDGPCTLKADGSFTKPGTETKSYKVYSTTGQTDKSDFPQDCFINCINPSPPNGLTFTEKTANTITITWNTGDNGDTIVDGYDIFHNNSIHNSYLVKGNRYTLDNLYPNTSYQIKVQKKTDPIFANLFSNEIEVKTDLPDCGSDDYTDSFIHNGSTYTSLAAVPCVSNHCGDMNVTKMYTPDNCKGSKADETVTKDCGYCVSTTGSNKFFHILFHDTNDVIDTRGISDWKRTLKSQFRFLVSGDIAGYQMNVGKTPYEMETLSQYHKEFVTFELEQCYQCTGDKVIQVILTKDRGSVKSHSNGDLYLHGGGSKLAHHQNRVIIPYNGVMYVEHELERVIGFGDNSHKSAIYYIKETKGSTYAKVDRSNSNPNESSLTWVSYRASATQFVITNDGLLLQESGNVPKLGTNSWMKMLKTQGNTVMTQPHTTPLPPTGTSYVNSKPLSNVSGPIKLISVHVNADTKVSAKALVGSQEASYHFTQSLLDTMLDTRCINDEHEWDWSPRGTYNPNGMIDFGIEIANTGIINQTPDRRSDIIPNDIRARLNALPRAGIEKFKLEYDLSENAYYLYYDAGVDNSIFYLTMKNMIACFTKQKTRNALILLETVTLDTLSIREQPARIKAYKIKFKTSGLYLSGNSSRNNPFSVSISPFSPHFIIISLNDGVMYPSKF